MVVFPCSICNKSVDNDAIFCNFCEHWVHPKCNQLNTLEFNKLVESDDSEAWSCFKCNCILFPFNSDFEQDSLNIPSDSVTKGDLLSNSTLFADQHFDSPDSLDCKYYDSPSFNEMISASNFKSDSSTSFFHLNINSLNLD